MTSFFTYFRMANTSVYELRFQSVCCRNTNARLHKTINFIQCIYSKQTFISKRTFLLLNAGILANVLLCIKRHIYSSRKNRPFKNGRLRGRALVIRVTTFILNVRTTFRSFKFPKFAYGKGIGTTGCYCPKQLVKKTLGSLFSKRPDISKKRFQSVGKSGLGRRKKTRYN